MAYLHAAPRVGNGGKRARSRLAQLRDDGAIVPMPPVPDEARALLEQFLEVGPVGFGVMGAIPVAFSEIEAWQRATGVELMPWEARLFRRLSVEYVNESTRAESPNAEPPWGPSSGHDRDDVARRVRLLFGARARESRQRPDKGIKR